MGMLLTQGTAFHREILCEGIDETPINGAIARHNALARKLLLVLAEVRATMLHEHIKLDKGILVEELLDALTCRHLALLMLLVDAGLAATHHDMLFLGFH